MKSKKLCMTLLEGKMPIKDRSDTRFILIVKVNEQQKKIH